MYLNNMILDGIASFAVLTALTSGCVQVVKKVGVTGRWLPLLALVIGVLLTLLGGWAEITALSILTGVAVGLSAVGLFENVKKIKGE